ncbi:hypothetical protein RCH21_003250 [Arthrobacter sp. PL16]|uniref:hypothetical protein n=1 Tax=Arthrobacter sp. PL16 TaxID=3071720 RepID=UPI002DFB8B2C|nr:hypothetical protein [Arthrobacter sp. PL16]
MPEQYLADLALLEALKAPEAPPTTPHANAGCTIAERAYLINDDELQGPTIDQLREGIGSNYSGADDSLFQDTALVAAAKDWHEFPPTGR